MDIEVLRHEFKSKENGFKNLEEEALFTLKHALKGTGIKLHSIPSRIKTFDSLLGKAQRKDIKNPWEEIQDIVGLRVICLFLSDINRIGQIIRDSFSVLKEDNKIEGTDVSSFGYMSVHFIVTMKSEFMGPRYDSLAKIPLEIQVRTIAMDAWANVSHHLDYKSEKDVPSDLRRDFYALSGLFYVADKHFEVFYGASKKSQEEMTEFFEDATPQSRADQEINLDSLIAYLQTKFPDRLKSSPQDISELIDRLVKSGYKTIGDVERLLGMAHDAFELYERENPPASVDERFNIVGVVRISAQLADEKFHRVDISNRSGVTDKSEVDAEIASDNKRYEKYRKLINK